MKGLAALLVVASWGLAADSRADDTTALAPSQSPSLVVTGTTRPMHVEVVMVGAGPASAEMAQAVRELVGAVPELTWTEGGAGPSDETSELPQVLIDVTDRERVRIVAVPARDSTHPARPAPPATVREVVIAGLSPDVARETVAQIVQTTVRALLEPDRERVERSLALAPSPMPPPPIEPATVDAADERLVTAREKAPAGGASEEHTPIDTVVGAVVSLGRNTFPFDTFTPVGESPIFDGVALSVGLRQRVLITTARLSAEWSELSDSSFHLTTQVVMASVGAAAHLDVGRLSLAIGVEAGAIVVREKISGPPGLVSLSPYLFPSGFDSNWWGGPLVAPRGTVDVRLFPRAFLRLEGGLPNVWTEPKHDSGHTVWTHHQYSQLMLGAGYSL